MRFNFSVNPCFSVFDLVLWKIHLSSAFGRVSLSCFLPSAIFFFTGNPIVNLAACMFLHYEALSGLYCSSGWFLCFSVIKLMLLTNFPWENYLWCLHLHACFIVFHACSILSLSSSQVYISNKAFYHNHTHFYLASSQYIFLESRISTSLGLHSNTEQRFSGYSIKSLAFFPQNANSKMYSFSVPCFALNMININFAILVFTAEEDRKELWSRREDHSYANSSVSHWL